MLQINTSNGYAVKCRGALSRIPIQIPYMKSRRTFWSPSTFPFPFFDFFPIDLPDQVGWCLPSLPPSLVLASTSFPCRLWSTCCLRIAWELGPFMPVRTRSFTAKNLKRQKIINKFWNHSWFCFLKKEIWKSKKCSIIDCFNLFNFLLSSRLRRNCFLRVHANDNVWR